MGLATARDMLVFGMWVSLVLHSHSAFAATHNVGGTSGWIIPMGNAQLFASWASGNFFRVGDKLVFNFSTNVHNVFQVTKANYDSCGLTNPLKTYMTGPATVTLNTTGAHYFICGIPGHCSAGQKVAITVLAASATSPNISPSSTPSPSPSTSPSSKPTPSPSPSSSSSSSPSPSSSSPPSSSPSPSSEGPSTTPGASGTSPVGSPGGSPSGRSPTGSPGEAPSSASPLFTSALTVCFSILYGVSAIFSVL